MQSLIEWMLSLKPGGIAKQLYIRCHMNGVNLYSLDPGLGLTFFLTRTELKRLALSPSSEEETLP